MDTKVDCTSCPGIAIKAGAGSTIKNNGERVVRILDGMIGSAIYGVHNASLVNLARGVVERVLYTRKGEELTSPVRPIRNAFARLGPLRSGILKVTRSTSVVAAEDYPKLYHDARKRNIYECAAQSLQNKAVTQLDAVVNTFVKAEKVNFSAKPDPAPRVIQPRSPRYNLSVGCYLKPFEKNMFDGFRRFAGYPVVCKGLNASGTAAQLRSNWEQFVNPVAVGLDASRFDQHVSIQALEFEHGFYNSIFNCPKLAELLRWQLVNKGVGYADGARLKYTVKGCRMSGDINTSLGNCIIMSCIVLAYLYEHNVEARLANNGDDCVVVCERKHLHLLDGIDAWFTSFGFKLTREQPVYEFEKIEFCQTQPVLTSSGWRMVRNPYTASSKDMVSLLQWDTQLEFDRWRGAIGGCGMSLTAGVPYWAAFYSRMGGVKHDKSSLVIRDSGLGYMARGMDADASISAESRYSFWRAFGMLPDEQVALEELEVEILGVEHTTPMMFGDIRPLHSLLLV